MRPAAVLEQGDLVGAVAAEPARREVVDSPPPRRAADHPRGDRRLQLADMLQHRLPAVDEYPAPGAAPRRPPRACRAGRRRSGRDAGPACSQSPRISGSVDIVAEATMSAARTAASRSATGVHPGCARGQPRGAGGRAVPDREPGAAGTPARISLDQRPRHGAGADDQDLAAPPAGPAAAPPAGCRRRSSTWSRGGNRPPPPACRRGRNRG